jgi:hypothetical protein
LDGTAQPDLPVDNVFDRQRRQTTSTAVPVSLSSSVTFAGSWPSSLPLVHGTPSDSGISITMRGSDYMPVWIAFQSSTRPVMSYTPGITIEQLELVGVLTNSYFD